MSNNDIILLLAKARTIEAEKRTALSLLRTGIVISTVPLSIFTVLISASKFYDFWRTLYPIIMLILVCLSLLGLGIHLILKGLRQMRSCEMALTAVKKLIGEG